jgi:tRNA (guanine-N7-)-methyltransferase
MDAQPFFEHAPPTRDRPADWPPTRYEAKALAAGRTPLYWVFRRR